MNPIDVFRPSHEPAQSIYDAFQKEAEKRKGRSVEEWIAAEHQAVLLAATSQAQILGLKVPSNEDVSKAELCARGHVDYGAKWAYGLVSLMRTGHL